MSVDKVDIILGYASIAAAAAMSVYGLSLRGMLPGDMKDDHIKTLQNMGDFYNELTEMAQGLRGEE